MPKKGAAGKAAKPEKNARRKKPLKKEAEVFEFKAEARQLLHLMVHALYSNREVFLRELISNASDAIDRLRFEALSKASLLKEDADLAIRIEYDEEARTLSVQDNGIGMSRQEVIDHLGTIAKSGTGRFLESLTGDAKKDARLIGQFGVGFYSAFVVADRVEVETRRAGEAAKEGTHFSSAGQEDFSIADMEKSTRGTRVTLNLKADAAEFLDDFRLRQLIRKYANYLSVPIQMPVTAKATDEAGEEKSDTKDSFEIVNQTQALWTLPKNKIKKEEYESFYEMFAHSLESPLSWAHNKVEGKLDYTSLLFLPGKASFDLYNRYAPKGLRLYVQRVFIMDDVEQFLPLYLRFVRGVIDSNDLPLNVSRELLQEDKKTQSIRIALTKRVLDMIAKLAKDEPEKYAGFWREFGAVLKEGLAEDPDNKGKLEKLLRFPTALGNDDETLSLADYVEQMPKEQEKIYFLPGETLEIARQSPHLEAFRAKKQNVLLCCDPVDIWVMPQLDSFQGKSIQDISRAGMDIDKADKDATDSSEDEPWLQAARETLGDRISELRLSKRLTDSPACLVLGEFDLSESMRRMMEASTGKVAPVAKPILELNPNHQLVLGLSELKGDRFDDLAMVLFEQAYLMQGGTLADPSGFVQRLNRCLTLNDG